MVGEYPSPVLTLLLIQAPSLQEIGDLRQLLDSIRKCFPDGFADEVAMK